MTQLLLHKSDRRVNSSTRGAVMETMRSGQSRGRRWRPGESCRQDEKQGRRPDVARRHKWDLKHREEEPLKQNIQALQEECRWCCGAEGLQVQSLWLVKIGPLWRHTKKKLIQRRSQCCKSNWAEMMCCQLNSPKATLIAKTRKLLLNLVLKKFLAILLFRSLINLKL